jgi:hypothetical protein
LGAIGDELHQTTSSHFSIPRLNKKILENRIEFPKLGSGGFKTKALIPYKYISAA